MAIIGVATFEPDVGAAKHELTTPHRPPHSSGRALRNGGMSRARLSSLYKTPIIYAEKTRPPDAPPIFDLARIQTEVKEECIGMEKNHGKHLEPVSPLKAGPTRFLSRCYLINYVKTLQDASNGVLRAHKGDEFYPAMLQTTLYEDWRGTRCTPKSPKTQSDYTMALMRRKLKTIRDDNFRQGWALSQPLWGESLPRKTKDISRQQGEFRRNHRHWDCTVVGVPPGAAIEVRAEGWIKVSDDFEMRVVPATRWRGWFKSAIKRGRGAVCGS
ncbi:hypothetical protein C8J57DRAFT_1248999 [Mycena rebaudengoi]|nr:hypothetical protein C8J57DRAFT_1248999 [Mycena rebaudengoi]